MPGSGPPRPHESVVRVSVCLAEARDIRGHVWGLEALGGLGGRFSGRDRLAPTREWCGFLVAWLWPVMSEVAFGALRL